MLDSPTPDLAPVRNVGRPATVDRGPPPRGRARRHSVLVRVLRWVLPATMVGVIATLVGFVMLHAAHRRDAEEKDADAPIEMINPRFFGRDSAGKAYILSARQAARDARAFQRVLLNFPSVILDTAGPHPSTVTADTGVYHEDSRMLYLKGHILADNAKSSKFATDEAVVNTRTGEVKSPTSLASRTSVGDLKSGGFDVMDKGDRVVFTGGVHARLNSH